MLEYQGKVITEVHRFIKKLWTIKPISSALERRIEQIMKWLDYLENLDTAK